MKDFFNRSILELGEFQLKVSSVTKLLVFILIVILFLHLLKKAINRAVKIDLAKRYAIYNLVKYFIIVLSLVISLQIIGLNLSVILAGSAALLVGIGLGLQNLFSDYVSGIILLINAPVKADDVIEVNGMVCRVKEINLRTTTVFTRDDKYIILPNTDLTKYQLINWTHSNINSRFEVKVGVDYSSDIHLVMKILKEEAEKQKGITKFPQPYVRFEEFGESSLVFLVLFWSEDVFRVERIKSELRIKIFDALRQNNIIIPFPQRVLHHRTD